MILKKFPNELVKLLKGFAKAILKKITEENAYINLKRVAEKNSKGITEAVSERIVEVNHKENAPRNYCKKYQRHCQGNSKSISGGTA